MSPTEASLKRQGLEDQVKLARMELSSKQQQVGIEAGAMMDKWRMRGEISRFAGDTGGQLTNYFSKQEEAKKAELDAHAAAYAAKGDEASDFYQSAVQRAEKVLDKMSEAMAMQAQTMGRLIV